MTHASEVSRCLKQKSIEKEGMVWTYNFGSKDFSQVVGTFPQMHLISVSVSVSASLSHLCLICLIKGTQDQDFSYSFSDSLSSLSQCGATFGFGNLPFNLTQSHTHTLLITCTCCYDEIKGTQDSDFSYSVSHSLILSSLSSLSSLISASRQVQTTLICGATFGIGHLLFGLTHILTHSLSLTCTCCYDETKGTQDLKIYSRADSLSLSHPLSLSVCHWVSVCLSLGCISCHAQLLNRNLMLLALLCALGACSACAAVQCGRTSSRTTDAQEARCQHQLHEQSLGV